MDLFKSLVSIAAPSPLAYINSSKIKVLFTLLLSFLFLLKKSYFIFGKENGFFNFRVFMIKIILF